MSKKASTGVTPRTPPRTALATHDCSMRVDLGRKLQFPRKITSTSLHPDTEMWSSTIKPVFLIELTVPWEAGIKAASERKKLKYSDLAAECTEAGWRTISLEEHGNNWSKPAESAEGAS